MLFLGPDRAPVAAGRVTVAFRGWSAPRVVAGRTYRTNAGRIVVDDVQQVDPADIDDADARAAGRPDAATLVAELERYRRGPSTFRIAFHPATDDDPRAALAATASLEDDERADLDRRLDRLDRASPYGPWTRQVLELVGQHEGVVSTVLAESAGRDRASFKLDVRKLKNLGLTESLDVGYRLSPRGRAYLRGDAEPD